MFIIVTVMTEFEGIDIANCIKKECNGFKMKGTWKLNMGAKGPEGFEVSGTLNVPKVDVNFNYIINARMELDGKL
jgi:hypothetical protein